MYFCTSLCQALVEEENEMNLIKTSKKIGLFLILLLAVFLIWSYLKPKKLEWERYTNSRYGFSIDYPANWQLGEAPANNDGREFISPDESITCRAYGFQNALTGAGGQPMTLEEFTDWLVSTDEVTKMGRNELVLADQPAYELLWRDLDGTIHQAVYILNPNEGRGLHCIFDTEDTRKSFAPYFRIMVSSFHSVDVDTEEMAFCDNLLSGVLVPFEDQQTFTDENYTEVTLTSREYWDKNKLPKKVLSLEGEGYICYPMPLEFEDIDQSAGIRVEPVVKKVQWDCELKYRYHEYVSSDDPTRKQELEKQGFSCEVEDCLDEDKNPVFVWLCTK